MPRKGHKSITIPEKEYNYFMDLWNEEKEELMKEGVRSFSAYVTLTLYRGLRWKSFVESEMKAREELRRLERA